MKESPATFHSPRPRGRAEIAWASTPVRPSSDMEAATWSGSWR